MPTRMRGPRAGPRAGRRAAVALAAALALAAVPGGGFFSGLLAEALVACPGSETGACEQGTVCCEDDARCYPLAQAATMCHHSCVCTAGEAECAALKCYNAKKSKADACFGKSCSGRGECFEGTCYCDRGSAGPDCGDIECLNGCNGNGACMAGICKCRGNWAGADCSEPVCPEGCNGQGKCACTGEGEDKVCSCKCNVDWMGAGCGFPGCPSSSREEVCSGHGTCEREGSDPHDPTKPFACTCQEGWGGEDCGQPRCIADCNGRGECRDGKCICVATHGGDACEHRINCGPDCERSGRAFGRCNSKRSECMCEKGWEGFDCLFQERLPDDCFQPAAPAAPGTRRRLLQQKNCGGSKHPLDEDGESTDPSNCPNGCSGKGVCIKGDCICRPGYAGRSCDGLACPNGCSGHGDCNVGNGKCVCHAGYSGIDCGAPGCAGSDGSGVVCSGHGQCRGGKCICSPPFKGDGCEAKVCPVGKNFLECSGVGACNDEGLCDCPAQRGGAACEKAQCVNDCHAHGVCIQGKCYCDDGFDGFDCGLKSCPADCSNHGDCDRTTGTCKCDDGFTGEKCDATICPVDCGANGVCNKDTRQCECAPGYGGVGCQVEKLPDTSPKLAFKAKKAKLSKAQHQIGVASLMTCAQGCGKECGNHCTSKHGVDTATVGKCETQCNVKCTNDCVTSGRVAVL